MLTIAIPTYNRNARLNKSLRILLPQLQADSSFYKLIFLDNCSPTPIAETLPEVLAEFPEISYEIVRNRQNIGANANIMRCFECCETEWIWCLSDDDPMMPDAVVTLRQHLATYPEVDYFNFTFDNNRPLTYLTTGIEDFIDKLDASANLPWISSSVHRSTNIQANIKYGYQFAYSMLPHVAALLMSLGTTGSSCMSAVRLMDDNHDPTLFEHNWSIVSFAIGSPVVYDIPLPFASRQALARKLLVTHLGESISLPVVVSQLLLSYFFGNERAERSDKGNLLYTYNQIVSRNYYLLPRLSSRRLLIIYYRLLLRFPRLTMRFSTFSRERLPKLLGRPDRAHRLITFLHFPLINSLPRQDRYEPI